MNLETMERREPLTPETMDRRRRRLAWRASHRGTKEMDLILGGFARERLAALDASGLDALEALIGVPDNELLAWILGRSAVPARYDTEVMAALRRFTLRSGGDAAPR
jgi:antitoxin CptB